MTQNYTVWLFAGFLLPWLLFQDTVMRCTSCLVDQSSLITKTVFPSEIVPVSIFLSSLVSHLLALVLAIVVIGLWLGHISAMILLLPIYMFVLGLFAVGIGWIFSSLQVYLRDTTQVVSVLLTFWFWTTPIFITEQQVPQRLTVSSANQSARVRGHRVPRAAAIVQATAPDRICSALRLRGRRFRSGRALFPAAQAWVCRRLIN